MPMDIICTPKVNLVTVVDFGDSLIWPWLCWWSEKTLKENGMQDRSPEWFRQNLSYAVFATNHESEIIAAAGLFPALDEKGGNIYHPDGRLIVEFGSLYVSAEYERQGIARNCVEIRKGYVRENNHFPIMVTRNLPMTLRILNGSAEPIDSHPHLNEAASKIRYCACKEEKKIFNHVCEFCPKGEKTILIFKEFM